MTKALPIVSIIIPAYNTAPYIHRAIESSLRQTHKNIEVIVIDDGSTDDTLKVAQEYASRDGRVRVFTQENAGVSVARNYGIREARGEYMIFLDSDDWLEDEAVAVFLDAQMKYPDKVIASVIYSVYPDDEHHVFHRAQANSYSSPQIFGSVAEVITAFHAYTPPVRFFHTAATKIFISEIIREHNIMFPEDIHYGEDQIFMLAYILQLNGAVLLNKPLIDVLERLDSAERGSYDTRRIFVDGELIDYLQVMIDMVDTPELKTLLKFNHAKWMKHELATAVRRRGSTYRIKKVREKMRMYQREFITSKYVSLAKKIDFMLGAYLPVPLARFVMLSIRRVSDTVKAIKQRNKGEGEVIPYW